MPMPDTAPLCRKTAAEGAVLLKNRGNLLPLSDGTRVALFGRVQTDYYKSGTGSGGSVHVERVYSLLEALRAEPTLCVDEELAAVYAAWIAEHPFDNGHGWATEPWCQEEMPLSDAVVSAAAARNDVAVVVLGRTAGESKDNSTERGSYYVSDAEEAMLAAVTAQFAHVVVLLNVGNVIDLNFTDTYNVDTVLYLWQGGAVGALAAADLLCGKAAPSGHLPDTQLRTLDGHPAHADFGNPERVVYTDDIYVGYRYYETFAPEKVHYPFGFGLTYTAFDTAYTATADNRTVTVAATVKNVGTHVGREVVQVYFEAPDGTLGTPARQLVGFAKTRELGVGESETLTVTFPVSAMAAYDDSGVSGYRSCYVLESGDYVICAGSDVRAAAPVLTYTVTDTTVTRGCEEALAPVTPFERLAAAGSYAPAPLRTVDTAQRIADRLPPSAAYTGDSGIRLRDVANGEATMDAFLAQLTDEELCHLMCGEGMCSPKVTAGTAGAFGGMTNRLRAYGIPPVCVSDGPSGIRLDNGSRATALPNGTLLASTWDTALLEQLYALIGEELCHYRVDILLGPGINLHRHPLCGRNFEYFSEDPYLTGALAAAVTRGIASRGVGSCIKHFCANNQEYMRNSLDVVVSERALRELYLRPFEIAVRDGANVSIMTSYNRVNGRWNASQYDLTTTVLRGEWGFDGPVMTDWWAWSNQEGGEGATYHLSAMVRAQNDVYMVCPDTTLQSHDLRAALADGTLTRGELQRCAANVLRFTLRLPAYRRTVETGVPVLPEPSGVELFRWESPVNGEQRIATFGGDKPLQAELHYRCVAASLAQLKGFITVDGDEQIGVATGTTGGQPICTQLFPVFPAGEHRLVCRTQEGFTIDKLILYQ